MHLDDVKGIDGTPTAKPFVTSPPDMRWVNPPADFMSPAR
jgi:hypothetical protein